MRKTPQNGKGNVNGNGNSMDNSHLSSGNGGDGFIDDKKGSLNKSMLSSLLAHLQLRCHSAHWVVLGFVLGIVSHSWLSGSVSKQQQRQHAVSYSKHQLVPASCRKDDGFLRVSTTTTDAAKSFDRLYRKGGWGTPLQGIESFYNNAVWPPAKRDAASGPGSTLGEATVVSMQILRDTIRQYDVSSMIDLPCGDANWIFDSWETDSMPIYIGLDVTDAIVKLNQERFKFHSNKVFQWWDGVECPIPRFTFENAKDVPDEPTLHTVDLIHSRDVIQHLPREAGVRFLCNVLMSGARVFVTTTYPHGKKNPDVRHGAFFPNDLTQEPYNLPKINCTYTHEYFEEKGSRGDQTCVYDLSKPWVENWLQKHECWV